MSEVKRTEADDGVVVYTLTVQPDEDAAMRDAAQALRVDIGLFVKGCIGNAIHAHRATVAALDTIEEAEDDAATRH